MKLIKKNENQGKIKKLTLSTVNTYERYSYV